MDLSLSLYIYIYTYIYICLSLSLYIYICMYEDYTPETTHMEFRWIRIRRKLNTHGIRLNMQYDWKWSTNERMFRTLNEHGMRMNEDPLTNMEYEWKPIGECQWNPRWFLRCWCLTCNLLRLNPVALDTTKHAWSKRGRTRQAALDRSCHPTWLSFGV